MADRPLPWIGTLVLTTEQKKILKRFGECRRRREAEECDGGIKIDESIPGFWIGRLILCATCPTRDELNPGRPP